jgi:2-polyprenyl-3-methyl-5-hydroxy-6-metoxy-1,4-benzoquinol methylase
VCGSAALALLRTPEAIGRDLACARRGLDGFLHDDARAVSRCRSCGSAFRHPGGARADDAARYASLRYRPETLERLRRRGRAEIDRRAARMRARGVVGGARLLEVGSYSGAFLEFARDMGCRATGLDVNADVAAHCDARGLDVRCGPFEAHRFGAGEFDGVWILNCFEQLPDHVLVLEGAARLLRPGGTLVIRTPNAAFLSQLYATAAGARLRAMADANAVLGVPYAVCFSPGALRRAIEAHGMRVERLEGRAFSSAAAAGWPRGAPAPWLEVTARRAPPAPPT